MKRHVKPCVTSQELYIESTDDIYLLHTKRTLLEIELSVIVTYMSMCICVSLD